MTTRQTLICGNNLELLARMPDCSVHAVVTDPPYGFGFMGKDWDKALPDPRTWSECLRVLRPGGHLVAFGAPRMYHRLTCQIEDVGFEVRDQLLWVFGSGFPKSLDVSKAIDAAAGTTREVVGRYYKPRSEPGYSGGYVRPASVDITAPATPESAKWAGWGTALKPAYEPIVLARKPLDGTVVQTVQRWGTGALNIDGCRVKTDDVEDRSHPPRAPNAILGGGKGTNLNASEHNPAGRWPANLILDEAAGAMLDAQSGTATSSGHVRRNTGTTSVARGKHKTHTVGGLDDAGGASRFFYCPKASRSEREAGLEHLPPRVVDPSRDPEAAARDNPRTGAGRAGDGRRNNHPTVKPIELMRWLVRLVTPPGGIVLEPFAGSGSTLVACALEEVNAIGMEIDPEYIEIARARVAHARAGGGTHD
jgi:site-specific DNA-methyltransferase (adenine-specific)